MIASRLGTWLRWLRATATFVYIAALCLAVAVLVIAFIPGSPVTQELPAAALTGLDRVGGVTAGVGVDPSGWIPFTIHDPSLAQRLLYLLTVLPGLALVAEIARRMANLLRAAQASDPFTAEHRPGADHSRQAHRVRRTRHLDPEPDRAGRAVRHDADLPGTFKPHQSPLGWLAVGLIFAALGQILDRGVAMRAELDTVI